MKNISKLLAALLALTLSFGALVSCEENADDTETPSDGVTDGNEENETPSDGENDGNEENENPGDGVTDGNEENKNPDDGENDGSEEKEEAEIGNKIGNKAPTFNLEREGSDEKVNVKNYKGKAVVINFWGTWCGPCKSELPDFDKLAAEYSDKLAIIAVHSVYKRQDAPSYIAENFAESDIIFAYDTLMGDADMYFEALGGTISYPYTVILDSDGIITYKHTGQMSYEKLKSAVDEALAK